MDNQPAYLALLASGELEARAAAALAGLAHCTLCPWRCGADRQSGNKGVCLGGAPAAVAAYGPSFNEEPPISGSRGSGAVFFSRCNLRCVFCHSPEISQADAGRELESAELAQVFLALQRQGCHNIQLVSPSHVTPQILAALLIAARAGLRLPLVYNTGGYDSLEQLALLDGVVDIYLPDLKFSDAGLAKQYCGARDYPAVSQAAVREMHRQVGNLSLDAEGIALRGLLVRALALPGGQAGIAKSAAFLAREVSPAVQLNLMASYQPAHRAAAFPILNRALSAAEWKKARAEVSAAGLRLPAAG